MPPIRPSRPRKRGSAPRFGFELNRQRKTDDFIGRSMVRPEVRSIKSQRTAFKRNLSQIFYLACAGRFQIQTSDTPVFVPLLRSPQNINGAIEKGMPADLSS